jgi:hypothetical protein
MALPSLFSSWFLFQTLQLRLAFVNKSCWPTPLMAVIFFGHCGMSHKELLNMDPTSYQAKSGAIHHSVSVTHHTPYRMMPSRFARNYRSDSPRKKLCLFFVDYTDESSQQLPRVKE